MNKNNTANSIITYTKNKMIAIIIKFVSKRMNWCQFSCRQDLIQLPFVSKFDVIFASKGQSHNILFFGLVREFFYFLLFIGSSMPGRNHFVSVNSIFQTTDVFCINEIIDQICRNFLEYSNLASTFPKEVVFIAAYPRL